MSWAAANGGITNRGLGGVWPPVLEIGLFRPFPAFFGRFQKTRTAPGKSRKRQKKGLFPQISSDLLNPPSLKPPFAAHQNKLTSISALWWRMLLSFDLFSIKLNEPCLLSSAVVSFHHFQSNHTGEPGRWRHKTPQNPTANSLPCHNCQ